MKLRSWVKVDPRMQERIRVIVRLGRRRDCILESPRLDLEALERLVGEYEEAEMPCAAEALRRRLEWYREKNFQHNPAGEHRGTGGH
jgi:hypothetical protein